MFINVPGVARCGGACVHDLRFFSYVRAHNPGQKSSADKDLWPTRDMIGSCLQIFLNLTANDLKDPEMVF